jgi:5-hydroxyisourate hydrolase-like protein (transthyretin family)
MRNTHLRAAGALLATAVGVTSAVVLAGPANAGAPIIVNGTVVTAEGTPLPGIMVTFQTLDGVVAGSAKTDSSGAYRVMRPTDTTYTIRFDDPSGTYASEWYNNTTSLAEADLVNFGVRKSDLGQTDLGAAAHLTGFVTGSTGAGIGGADVTAYVMKNGSWSSLLAVKTQPDGQYDLGLLPGGTYTLGFHDPATNVGEYWNDKADLTDANALQVKEVGTTDGLNAQLATPLPEPTPTETPTTTPTTPTTATTTTTTTTTPVNTAAPAATATAVTVAVRPRIRGIAKVAKTLRVTKGTWTPTTVTKKIQWLANGKRIKGATKNRLRLTKKLAGKRISVRIVASAPGLTKLKVTTKRTKKVRR